MGLLITPLSVATVNCVSQYEVALASSLSSLSQQVGGAVGVAGLSVIHQFAKNQAIDRGLSDLGSEATAVQVGFVIAGILMLASLIPAYWLPQLKSTHAETIVDVH